MKFKVGDRVIFRTSSFLYRDYNGKQGTISKCFDISLPIRERPEYHVNFDDGKFIIALESELEEIL